MEPETFNDLASVVLSTIRDTMAEGQTKKHLPGIWQTEPVDHQVAHGTTHLLDYARYGHRDDLEHALCRIAFAMWALDNRGVKRPAVTCSLAEPAAESGIACGPLGTVIEVCGGCGETYCAAHIDSDAHACEGVGE